MTLSRLAPDMAPLPPRRLELYINSLSSEEGLDGSFLTSELCRQVWRVMGSSAWSRGVCRLGSWAELGGMGGLPDVQLLQRLVWPQLGHHPGLLSLAS